MKLRHIILGGAIALATLSTTAHAAPPITFNVSHRTTVPELASKIWSSHARIRKHVSWGKRSYLMLTQQRPRNFDNQFAPRWGQIIAVRDGSGTHVVRNADGTHVLLPDGRPNMVVTPERMYFLAKNKLTRDPVPPALLVIDEVTANTSKYIAYFLHIVDTKADSGDPVAQEIRKRLAFFVVGGDDVRPQSFPKKLRDFLRKNQSPVYAELYGGKVKAGKTSRVQLNARMQGYAIKRMKALGWNVRPMVSAKPLHIGTDSFAVKQLKLRVDAIIRNTGMRPSYWHLNAGKFPAPKSLARLAVRVSKPSYRPPRLTPRELREIKELTKSLHRQRKARAANTKG